MYSFYTELLSEEIKNGDERSVNSARVTHRYGEMQIGEVIVLIAVAAGHRNEAFLAARYIIDELKVRVPIWKADVFSDKVSWIHGEKE